MSRVVSLRLQESQMERLGRLARHLGRSPSETAARLIEEALRMAEFSYIEFRNSFVGRQAYVMGTSLAVWEVLFVARAYENDVVRTAEHLNWPPFKVQAALRYATAFPDEINAALEDNDSYDLAKMSRLLPQLRVFRISGDDSDAGTVNAEDDGAGAEGRAAPAAG